MLKSPKILVDLIKKAGGHQPLLPPQKTGIWGTEGKVKWTQCYSSTELAIRYYRSIYISIIYISC